VCPFTVFTVEPVGAVQKHASGGERRHARRVRVASVERLNGLGMA